MTDLLRDFFDRFFDKFFERFFDRIFDRIFDKFFEYFFGFKRLICDNERDFLLFFEKFSLLLILVIVYGQSSYEKKNEKLKNCFDFTEK